MRPTSLAHPVCNRPGQQQPPCKQLLLCGPWLDSVCRRHSCAQGCGRHFSRSEEAGMNKSKQGYCHGPSTFNQQDIPRHSRCDQTVRCEMRASLTEGCAGLHTNWPKVSCASTRPILGSLEHYTLVALFRHYQPRNLAPRPFFSFQFTYLSHHRNSVAPERGEIRSCARSQSPLRIFFQSA